MKSSIFALALAAGLLAGPALAQPAAPAAPAAPASPDHSAHHPQTEQTASPSMAQGQSTPAQRPGGMMPGMGQGMGQGMMGSGMMGQGMMSCPMMQGTMQMAQPRGDQGVASLAMNAVNERMHREMAITYTGNVDADFARNMIAHHQAAIDMARIALAFGKDAKIRQLAEAIVKAQEDEIATMKAWLAENAKQ